MLGANWKLSLLILQKKKKKKKKKRAQVHMFYISGHVTLHISISHIKESSKDSVVLLARTGTHWQGVRSGL